MFCQTVKSFALLLGTLMIPLPEEIKIVNEKYRDGIIEVKFLLTLYLVLYLHCNLVHVYQFVIY